MDVKTPRPRAPAVPKLALGNVRPDRRAKSSLSRVINTASSLPPRSSTSLSQTSRGSGHDPMMTGTSGYADVSDAWRNRAPTPIHTKVMATLEDIYRRQYTPRSESAMESLITKYEAMNTHRSLFQSSAAPSPREPRLASTLYGSASGLVTPRTSRTITTGMTQQYSSVDQRERDESEELNADNLENEIEMCRRRRLHRIEDLGRHELRILQLMFEMRVVKNVLSEDQFVQIIMQLLDVDEREIRILFRQIDSDADDAVSWDDLTAFLHSSGVHAASERGKTDMLETTPHIKSVSHSSVMIEKIQPLQEIDMIATCGRDGIVQIWDSFQFTHKYTLTPLAHVMQDHTAEIIPPVPALNTPSLAERGMTPRTASIVTSAPSGKSKKSNAIYPTDMAWVPSERKFYVCSLDRSVTIYDTKRQFKEIGTFPLFDLPMCMHVGKNMRNNNGMVLVGDSHGSITCYNSDTYELLKCMPIHSECATRVRYYDNIGIMSAGMDGKVVLTDAYHMTPYNNLTAHKRTVCAFDYAPEARLIATGGLDRTVIIWTPYVSKPSWTLDGHLGSIIDVSFNEAHNQLISVGADKVIKVWDIRKLQCVQSINDDSTYFPNNQLTAAAFDLPGQRLLTAGSHLRVWPVEVTEKQRLMRTASIAAFRGAGSSVPVHTAPVIGIHYAEKFGKLVTVDSSGKIRLWELKTGSNLQTYSIQHNEAIIATTMDKAERRLVTASSDGVIKMWNIHNGQFIHEFPKRVGEVASLTWNSSVYTRRPLVCGGWDHCVTMFADVGSKADPQKMLGHSGDVLSVVVCGQLLMASGGSDGAIILWNINTGRAYRTKHLTPMPSGHLPGVEKIVYLEKQALLVVFGQDCNTHMYDARTLSLRLENAFTVPETVGDAVVNSQCTRLLVGDTKAQLELFDISALGEGDNYAPKSLKKWHCRTSDSITSMLAIASPQCFVVATQAGHVQLFDLDGHILSSLLYSGSWPSVFSVAVDAISTDRQMEETGPKRVTHHPLKDALMVKKASLHATHPTAPHVPSLSIGNESPVVPVKDIASIWDDIRPKTARDEATTAHELGDGGGEIPEEPVGEGGSQTERIYRPLWGGIPVHTVSFSAREQPKVQLQQRRVRTEFEPPC